MIDRFDVRAHLDYIPTYTPPLLSTVYVQCVVLLQLKFECRSWKRVLGAVINLQGGYLAQLS